MSTSKRISSLDAMKGLLIILVVLGHVIQSNYLNYQHEFSFRLIYSFHMPLFFLISGYLNYKEKHDNKLINRRAVQLLVPFVVWALLTPFLENGDFNINRFVKILLYPDNGLWFLYNLFVYCAIFNLSERFAIIGIRQEIILVIFVCVLYALMIVFHTKFNCSQLCWYVLYFAIGYYAHKYQMVYRIFNKFVWLFGMMFLLTVPFWMMRENPLFYKWINLGSAFSYFYRYLVQICGSIFLFFVGVRYLTKNIPFINELGKKTLGVYAFQFITLFYLNKFTPPRLCKVTYIIAETVICIILCYIFVNLIHRIKYIRLLLLGEK